MAPAMSFKTNVMPVLTASCALGELSRRRQGAQGGLFLGAQLEGRGCGAGHTSLVGPMASELARCR